MQEPTDSQLDGLFRKSAEEFDTPFDPAAWQALKNRLDNHDRLTIWEHLLRWGLPVLLLLLLTGGSWNAYRQQRKGAGIMSPAIASPGIAMLKSGPAGITPKLTPSEQKQQRTTHGQALSGETATDLDKSNQAASDPKSSVSQPQTDAVRPGKHERAESPKQANAADNADEAIIASSTGATRSRPAATNSPPAATRDSKPVNSKPVKDAVPAVPTTATRSLPPLTLGTAGSATDRSASVELATTKRDRPGSAATAGRAERVRPATNPQRQWRELSGKHVGIHLAATSPGRAYRPGSADNANPQPVSEITGQPFARKVVSKTGSQSTANATERLTKTEAPPSSASTVAAAEPAPLLSFIELSSRPGLWPDRLPFRGRDVTASEIPILPTNDPEMKTQPVVQSVVSQKGLSIRFVVSPDLSAIGLRNFQRPGTNVGLLLEYRLASRWSVQAGLIQSTKVYKALASDYKLSAYSSKWKVFPESVSGRCNMLDIPINLRYDIALRPRLNGQSPSRWFVSGGVTTYIMRQEDYVNNFSEADKPHVYPGMEGWHGRTGTYGFSQLNLSVGYERSLSRRLSWQVEPFLKAPLKGVGYYKINLLSTGAFFSLRYKL